MNRNTSYSDFISRKVFSTDKFGTPRCTAVSFVFFGCTSTDCMVTYPPSYITLCSDCSKGSSESMSLDKVVDSLPLPELLE
jgi:hypothetical protein